MKPPKILLQLDTDPHASSFDAIVATDAGVDTLLQYSGVTPDNVESLVHGAMFTRGPEDLHRTAIFVGGSDVAAGEAVYERIVQCFFGPMRVSVMLDSNGSNTTAAAAVVRAAKHLDLSQTTALVLAGTGPVGQRVARLLLQAGATVRLSSRQIDRAQAVCDAIGQRLGSGDRLSACQGSEAIAGCDAVFACGAAGVQLLDAATLAASDVRLAIDLNAVPPVGIEGIDVMDRGKATDQRIEYGAIGVGGTKMKIHRAAIKRLFKSNDQRLDAETIHAIARDLR
ncbi:Bifunctional protein MdtA [Rosistilla carotiformis]|uniref:Bifunctional protein MdtA n=1 Tax=Rosistilla carotiformis TaxID=2528017 RepID=A0A518JT32_9BACT|nr:NADP-dependent methylenetetrahydromethanopterin/methylenetetrahydrofolate dehydrogenase [Rosistilla carotiformis]QDV68699.1 Bifunctional protein MdtA [Rosistilla carotiformis]